MDYAIVFFLFLFSLIMIGKYKSAGILCFIIFLASDTDSTGPFHFIETFIPFFKILTRIIILMLFLWAIYNLLVRNKAKIWGDKFLVFIFIPILISTIFIFISLLLQGSNMFESLNYIIWQGTPFFFIWLWIIYKKRNFLFKYIILIQVSVSFLVIAFKEKTASLNGASYYQLISGLDWEFPAIAIINSDFSLFDFNKYNFEVMKFGHFHNPNTLGFYSIIALGLGFYLIYNKLNSRCNTKKSDYLIGGILITLGSVLWFNSLTKAPIILLMLYIAFYILSIALYPKNYKRIFLVYFLFFILSTSFLMIYNTISYLIESSLGVSLNSRISGFLEGFEKIKDNPLIGSEQVIGEAVPHILFLKVAAYYGIPAGFILLIPFIFIGSVLLKKWIVNLRRKDSVSNEMLLANILFIILVGIAFTNGVVAYVLFWIILAEICNISLKLNYNEVEIKEKYVKVL